MRHFAPLLICIALVACSDPAPKTGSMPGITTGEYDAPKNAEAAAAYMSGFHARYDIPELDYPEEIKIRIRKAQHARFTRDMENGRRRSELMAKLALTVMAQKDPEAKEVLEKLKRNPKAKPSPSDISQLIEMAEYEAPREVLSKSERGKIYKDTLRDYKSNFRSLKVEACRWTKLKRLIGTGHEQMAFIHGSHPTHGYRCDVSLKTEERKGYPRARDFSAFWVKMPSGDWAYYGKFYGVGISPRTQRLDQNLLKDPEGTIMRQSTWDSVAASLHQ